MVAAQLQGMDCNYASMRHSPEVIKAVEDGLIAEQGGICAYTFIFLFEISPIRR